jgi:hypothetical protein
MDAHDKEKMLADYDKQMAKQSHFSHFEKREVFQAQNANLKAITAKPKNLSTISGFLNLSSAL